MFLKPKRGVKRVFIHCSASDEPQHDNVKTIKEWHLKRGFNDIGYHFYIDKDGVVWNGRSLELMPAAQEGNNLGTIAICLGGLKWFSEKQFISLVKLCQEINEDIPGVTFHGHCEVSKKSCPVFDYKKVLGLKDGKMLKA
jgi:N-acetylmuramoyl-L-alanine amidase